MITFDWPDWKKKRIPEPFDGENLKCYGDRLLWHQLALQLHDLKTMMLTEAQYIAAIMHFYPGATEANVRQYRNYFNSRHKSMGFRGECAMPVQVEFANS